MHAHIGSQIFEVAGFVETHARSSPSSSRDDDFDELCVGGGLGVAYVAGETRAVDHRVGRAPIRARRPRGRTRRRVRLLAEPGRAIVAQAAVTLYSVGAVKPVAQRTYMAVDGGMSDNPRPVLYGSGYEAFDVDRPLARRDPSAVRLVGKHCESGDVLIDEAWLPAATGVGSVDRDAGDGRLRLLDGVELQPRPASRRWSSSPTVPRAQVLRRETFDDLARLEV